MILAQTLLMGVQQFLDYSIYVFVVALSFHAGTMNNRVKNIECLLVGVSQLPALLQQVTMLTKQVDSLEQKIDNLRMER